METNRPTFQLEANEQDERKPFILGNTKAIELTQLQEDYLVPVFSRDNVETISHSDFINVVADAAQTFFHGEQFTPPQIRVSHEMIVRTRSGNGKLVENLEKDDTTKYVSYLRVSTQKQGYSGLGIEAQKEIIQNHLRNTAPIAEYIEVESGRNTDKERPQLRSALEHCRKENATLIVAKLDRLARNVSFLSSLLENDVEIVFCDFPQANKMVLHILAAISQYEAELIATRTKQALAAKKARGTKLGNPEHLLNKHREAVANSNRTNREKARINPNNKRAVAFLKVLVSQEYTYNQMAETLNREGFVTSQGFQFTPSTVYKLIKRYNLR